MSQSVVYEIVLTGGPCSGKTTATAHIIENLSEKGINVFVVPEAATMLMQGGMQFSKLTESQLYRAQRENAKLILEIGNSMQRMAKAMPGISVVLYDRAIMDAAAFLPKSTFESILEDLGIDLWQARDRYDGVIHLTSCAVDAPKYYTLENNKARSESIEEAAAIDHRLKQVWTGTQHHRVIDNSTNFAEKMSRITREIFHIIGEPEPLEIEKKFLVGSLPDWNIPELLHKRSFHLTQYYLKSESGIEERVRKREGEDYQAFFHTRKTSLPDGSRIEQESVITEKEYAEFLNRRSNCHREIEKIRHCFIYDNQYFELDEFLSPEGLYICEVELTNFNEQITLPPFLDVIKEVTHEPGYKNSKIAQL